VLKGALGLGIGFTVPGLASALVADDERQARPRKGDRLVFAYGVPSSWLSRWTRSPRSCATGLC